MLALENQDRMQKEIIHKGVRKESLSMIKNIHTKVFMTDDTQTALNSGDLNDDYLDYDSESDSERSHKSSPAKLLNENSPSKSITSTPPRF